MNCKNEPQECEAKLCCKATASLDLQVEEEKKAEDKSLAQLLEEKAQDEDQNNQ